MDEHHSSFSAKYPVDPFRRDNVFIESSHLISELQMNSNIGMNRKNSRVGGSNQNQSYKKNDNSGSITNQLIQRPKAIDYNVLNVIKSDHKT